MPIVLSDLVPAAMNCAHNAAKIHPGDHVFILAEISFLLCNNITLSVFNLANQLRHSSHRTINAPTAGFE